MGTADRPRRLSTGPVPANLPRIVRPQGLPRAARPVDPPSPEHHHLPGWVRRVHGQARPILADLLGNLSGEPLQRYQASVDALIAGMSSGKFSLAWQYPKLIDEGMQLFEQHRRQNAELFAAQRVLDQRRKRASDGLREAGARLAPDVIARLNRALRNATAVDEIDAVSAELEQSVTAARSNEERRRDREIDKTRSRIRKTLPRATATEPAETWQDVLRRFAENQAEG
ncbi:MAG: hypothetical protein M3R48_07025 [Candidatus Dormibacteraeota bacterium]|nr:hypothetical protein [Candidatus Dormibacteraeota bacterium]